MILYAQHNATLHYMTLKYIALDTLHYITYITKQNKT